MKIKYNEFLNTCTDYENFDKRWHSQYNTKFFNKFFEIVEDGGEEENKIIFHKNISNIENEKYVMNWYYENNNRKQREYISINFILYKNGNFEINNYLHSKTINSKKIEKQKAQKFLDIYSKYLIDLFNEIKKMNLFIED